MDADKRTLLVLMTGLGLEYDSLIQVWNSKDDMTGEKAVTMLREEEVRRKYGSGSVDR
jgi:hypothetical protein